jgi:hypothetical protein
VMDKLDIPCIAELTKYASARTHTSNRPPLRWSAARSPGDPDSPQIRVRTVGRPTASRQPGVRFRMFDTGRLSNGDQLSDAHDTGAGLLLRRLVGRRTS